MDAKDTGLVLTGLVAALLSCLSKGDELTDGLTGEMALGDVEGGVTELVTIVGGGSTWVLVSVVDTGTESLAVDDVLGLCSFL